VILVEPLIWEAVSVAVTFAVPASLATHTPSEVKSTTFSTEDFQTTLFVMSSVVPSITAVAVKPCIWPLSTRDFEV
jgi:hypothetical protein